MRVSDALQYRTVLSQLGTVQSNLLVATKQASSGLRVDRPSADPIAAAQAARVDSGLDSISGFRSTIAFVRGDLEIAESTLATATDVMQRASELALQAANGSQNAETRTYIAEEVRQLREQLVALANQKGAQGYLFGGTATNAPPFTPAGVFVGNDLDRVAQIGENDTAVVSASGAQAFTLAGGRDVFTDLADFETALLADDQTAIAASVNNIDTSRRQILAARIDAGLRIDRLQTSDTAHEQLQLSLTTQKSSLTEINPAEAYSRFIALQQGLDQAIAVSRNILSTIGKARFG